MTNSDIEHMAQGYPPSHIGKDHEEVVIELASSVIELQQKLDAMAAENAALKSSIPSLKDVDLDNDNMDDVSLAEDVGFNDAVTLMNRWKGDTPATDAYLNSVRAEGVDLVKFHPAISLVSLTHICDEIAERLRSGTHDTADKEAK